MLVVEPVQAAIWHCINNYGQFQDTVLIMASTAGPLLTLNPQLTVMPLSWLRDSWTRVTVRWEHPQFVYP